MRLLSILVAVLVVGAAACTEPGDTTIDLAYDPCAPIVLVPAADTTAVERASIEAAIALWNDVTPVGFTLDDVAGAPHVPISFEPAALAIRGVYEDELGDVIINRNLVDDDARAITIAHELGHVMGLFHVSGRESIMNPGNLTFLPNEADVAGLTVTWGHACEVPAWATASAMSSN